MPPPTHTKDDTVIQKAILDLAKRYRYDPTKLTEVQYLKLSLMARRTLAEKAKAAGSAIASATRTKVLRLRVLPSVAAANEAKCRSCPSDLFSQLADQEVACGACGCAGRFLRSKWHDPQGACPKGHWTNLGRPTVDPKLEFRGEVDSGGDASGAVVPKPPQPRVE